MEKLSRHAFFRAAGAAVAANAAEAHALKTGTPPAPVTQLPAYIFFNPDEAKFIEAAIERLYRSGRWHDSAPTQVYRLRCTPAKLFCNALRGIRDDFKKRSGPVSGGGAYEAQTEKRSRR